MFGIEQSKLKTLSELQSAIVAMNPLIDDESNELNFLRTVEGTYDAWVEDVTSLPSEKCMMRG